jgi:hypothetical protein
VTADFAIVARQWAEITGQALQERPTHRVDALRERADSTFATLAERAFDDEAFLERLSRLSAQWLARCPNETTRAIAAYAAYLRGDYPRAATLLMGCIGENAENVDNWMDLAFALNHCADPLGRHILFNLEEYIDRFAGGMCTRTRLEALRDEIEAAGAGYAGVYMDWIDGDALM